MGIGVMKTLKKLLNCLCGLINFVEKTAYICRDSMRDLAIISDKLRIEKNWKWFFKNQCLLFEWFF